MDILLDPNVAYLILLGGVVLGFLVGYSVKVVRSESFVLVVEKSNAFQS